MAVQNLERWQEIALPEKEATHWHDRGAGRGWTALGIKLRANGSHSWIWEYKTTEGKTKRITYGRPSEMSFEDAYRRQGQDAARLQEGVDPAAEKRVTDDALMAARKASEDDAMTFSTLLDKFLVDRIEQGRRTRIAGSARERRPLKPRYIERVKTRLEVAREAWGTRLARSLAKEDMVALRSRFGSRLAALELLEVHLDTLWTWALDEELIDKRPWSMKDRKGSHVTRVRYLDDAEAALALQSFMSTGYPSGYVCLLAMLTGCRREELLQAEWSEFDLDGAIWTMPAFRAKNARNHTLPLTPIAIAILRHCEAHKVGAGQYVFRDTVHDAKDRPLRQLRSALSHANKATKPASNKRTEPEQRVPFSPHDLRRTAATHLEGLGCPDAVLKRFLNHSDGRGALSTYLQNKLGQLDILREWMVKLEEHYLELAPSLKALLRPVDATEAA